MTTQTLKVTGMSCGHCKAAVEKAVGAVPGVKTVEADVAGARVQVSYQDQGATLDLVKTAITETGYTVAG